MIELEKQGYRWSSEDLPTELKKEVWDRFRENTYILSHEDSKRISYGYMGITNFIYPKESIIKHKAKGVNRMEKVVVPQFLADWYEQYKEGFTLYGILSELTDDYYSIGKLDEWVRSVNNESNDGLANAQEIIAKMYLHGYEVEEKTYYWRKKKEYSFNFEHRTSRNYLNIDGNGRLFFSDKAELSLCKTKFTETKVKQLVSEEDFNKLEKVEITE